MGDNSFYNWIMNYPYLSWTLINNKSNEAPLNELFETFIENFRNRLMSYKGENKDVIIGLPYSKNIKYGLKLIPNLLISLPIELRERIVFLFLEDKSNLENFNYMRQIFLDECLNRGLIKKNQIIHPLINKDFNFESIDVTFALIEIKDDNSIFKISSESECFISDLKKIEKLEGNGFSITPFGLKSIKNAFVFIIGKNRKEILNSFKNELNFLKYPPILLKKISNLNLYIKK